jgi:hypothetical protein
MKNRGIFSLIIILFIVLSLLGISAFNLFNFNKNELKVTLEHLFFLDGKWIKAADLKVGDLLLTPDGKKARIKKITDVDLETPVIVYNLEDRLYNNYVANGVVVHNSNMLERNFNIPDNDIIGGARAIDIERIELETEELTRIIQGRFTPEESDLISNAENKLKESGLLSEGQHLSFDQQRELLISHNSANSLYGIDDYSRISTKSRFLEHYSLNEKRVLMESWITGKGNFLDSSTSFVSSSGKKSMGLPLKNLAK